MKKITMLSFVYLLVSVNFLFGQDKFLYANPGEYWIILSDDVAVMQTPEAQTDRASFNRMLVTVIGRNTKVKVLESKGWLSVWHKVNVLSDDGIVAIGWILTEVVKSAKKTTKNGSKSVSSNKWGVVRYTHGAANVRESRNTSSKLITQLKTNQKVKADFLKDGWYAIFEIDEYFKEESNAIGFVHSSLLYPEPKSDKSATTSNNLLSFKIVKKEDQGYRGTSRMTYRVLLNVSEKPKEQKIKNVALAIWNDGNKSWKEFTVFLYLPEMNTNSMAYGIANFTPSGLKDFNVQEYALWDTKWQQK
jgi:uncharacterized protein YgiM (DUF1202 family)